MKARTLGIALTSLLVLSCGFDADRGSEVVDRPQLVRAQGGPSDSEGPVPRRVLQAPDLEPDAAFGRLIGEFSESGGFFNTDNLVSNERPYLHVLGALRRRGVSGGAYIGVGPDQNFSYIAAIRPEVAFIVDLRRDNVLQHLMFKALFEMAETRVEYLSLLLGRALPENPREWWAATPEELVEYVSEARGGIGTEEAEFALDEVVRRASNQGVEVSAEDLQTIRAFHETFIRFGMLHRFSSFGSEPRIFYPTYEELITERDLDGERGSYVADRGRYTYLRDMQATGRIIPVVGDFAGDRALRAIGDEIRERGLTVSAFYTSNVEFYVWEGTSLGAYLGNLRRLPTDDRSVIIRSYFPIPGLPHPDLVDGYTVTQTLQPLGLLQEDGIQNRVRSYFELVTHQTIDLGGQNDG